MMVLVTTVHAARSVGSSAVSRGCSPVLSNATAEAGDAERLVVDEGAEQEVDGGDEVRHRAEHGEGNRAGDRGEHDERDRGHDTGEGDVPELSAGRADQEVAADGFDREEDGARHLARVDGYVAMNVSPARLCTGDRGIWRFRTL